MKLPGWVVDNRTAVSRDVERYRTVAPADSWPLVVEAGNLAVAQLGWDPDARGSLDWRDPLPRSTIEALARLRRANRG